MPKRPTKEELASEAAQMNLRKRTLTRMQKRDIRDGVSLAMSALGTAISAFALLITLSPRSDPEGFRLAGDLNSYFRSRGVAGFTTAEIQGAVSSVDAIPFVVRAVKAVGGDAEARGLVRRLRTRRRSLR